MIDKIALNGIKTVEIKKNTDDMEKKSVETLDLFKKQLMDRIKQEKNQGAFVNKK